MVEQETLKGFGLKKGPAANNPLINILCEIKVSGSKRLIVLVEQETLKGLGLKKGPAANNPNRAKRQARQRILN